MERGSGVGGTGINMQSINILAASIGRIKLSQFYSSWHSFFFPHPRAPTASLDTYIIRLRTDYISYFYENWSSSPVSVNDLSVFSQSQVTELKKDQNRS
jgi:hypothetical protein